MIHYQLTFSQCFHERIAYLLHNLMMMMIPHTYYMQNKKKLREKSFCMSNKYFLTHSPMHFADSSSNKFIYISTQFSYRKREKFSLLDVQHGQICTCIYRFGRTHSCSFANFTMLFVEVKAFFDISFYLFALARNVECWKKLGNNGILRLKAYFSATNFFAKSKFHLLKKFGNLKFLSCTFNLF